jgi:hypothetical protein
MNWMIACKQAVALMVAREDRELVLRERAALRVHLLICTACTRFDGQLMTMRQAMAGWRHYRENELKNESDTPPEALRQSAEGNG